MKKVVKILKIDEHAKLPTKAMKGDVGYDLFSNEDVNLAPNEIKVVGTGIKMALPAGIEAQVRPKSGLAANYGITVLNTPGTIDPNYRGEIKVILVNFGNKTFKIERGQKIAQLVFHKFETPTIKEVKKLDVTERNEGGFGSTGLK
ncbi:MAG: dUTP diphosphatase [Candidatus Diapherotrites archaeon]